MAWNGVMIKHHMGASITFTILHQLFGISSKIRLLSKVNYSLLFQNCPALQRLKRISNWGRIDPEQIHTIRKEIKARNFDLIIDDGDESDDQEE